MLHHITQGLNAQMIDHNTSHELPQYRACIVLINASLS